MQAWYSGFEAVENDCGPSDATNEHISRARAVRKFLPAFRDLRGTTGERFLDLGIVPLSVLYLQLYDYKISIT